MSKCKDGTDLLCRAVYRREARPSDYLGGSDARMLVDAAKEIHAQRRRLELRQKEVELLLKWAKEQESEVLGPRSEAEDLHRVLQDLCVLALQDHRYQRGDDVWRVLVDEGLALTIHRPRRKEG